MGHKIKEARVQQKMSQEELSKKSGVSRTTISGLETGQTKVAKTSTLIKIATALDKKIDDIFFKDIV